MAHATYDAANNRFRGTQSVASGTSYLVMNTTKCSMDVLLDHSSANVDTIDVKLAPGEAFAHAQGTSGTITFTGIPSHTHVNATVAYEFIDDNGAPFNSPSASLVYSPF